MSKIPSIESLIQEKNIKDNSKQEIFNIVLKKCIDKIIYTNRHTDKTFVIFEVPKILIGYPSYDINSCIRFLIAELSRKKYLVNFIEPFYLYIDWGSLSINGQNVAGSSNLKEQTKLLLKKFPGSKIEYVYEDSVAPKLGESSSKIKSKKKNNK
jgi:hypothetical protein